MVSLQLCAVVLTATVAITALTLDIIIVVFAVVVAVVVAVVDGHVVVVAFLVVVVAARGTLQLHQHHEWHQLPIELDQRTKGWVMSHHLQPMAACKPCAIFDFQVLLLVIFDVPHVLGRGAVRLQARGGAWGERGGGAWGERGGVSVG